MLYYVPLEEKDMSIMIDLPPAMAQEARDYATVQGTTLERMLFDCLKAELDRRHKADEAMAELDALVLKTSKRLTGEPYRFRRADAYEPETVLA